MPQTAEQRSGARASNRASARLPDQAGKNVCTEVNWLKSTAMRALVRVQTCIEDLHGPDNH